MNAFFIADGDCFVATENTIGPWHADYQHAGPPTALMGRAIEQIDGDLQVVRITNDLLKPVPVGRLRIDVTDLVPGKRRRVVEVNLLPEGETKPVARITALLLRQTDLPLDNLPEHDGPPPISPKESEPTDFPFFLTEVGYHKATELRLASGGWGTGKTQMWFRQRVPLVAGETPSPLQRLLVMADCGNGTTIALDKNRYSFVNPDLSVNIRRPAVGEWLCLDAQSHCQQNGIGMSESRIWDEHGVLANATQNLLLERV